MFSYFPLSKKRSELTESDGRRGRRNKFKKICLVPDLASKVSDVVKIGMEKKFPISNISNIYSHVSIMAALSELIMASLSTLFPFPFPPIVYPVLPFPPLPPPTPRGLEWVNYPWCGVCALW